MREMVLVWVMLIAGVVGYFLSKLKVPTSPAILGLILGPWLRKTSVPLC